ncbi:NAD(P)-binding protein [Auricularia subglabra TFB-10046 SS5]|nr:NAD(P)-binding protein [Auricularia subglabra TFB-10046 SS5]
MSDKKLITVFGATGAAGGSVAKYMLEDGTFAVPLKAQGAEVVFADLDKPETIAAALKGSYGVSALTDFWGLFAKNGNVEESFRAEIEHGKALVDAARAERLLKKGGEGRLVLDVPIPEAFYIPSYSVDQTGAWALTAFKNPKEWIGKDMVAVAEHLTLSQYADVLARAFGMEVTIPRLSLEEFEKRAESSDPYSLEMYLGMKFFVERCQPPSSAYDEEASKRAYPGAYTFEQFVQNNARFKQRFMEQFA